MTKTQPTLISVPVKSIELDPSLQMRVNHDTDFVDTLAELLLENSEKQLDPVILFHDWNSWPHKYYIGDGNHRVSAYRLAHRSEIPAVVHQGDKEAAWKHALGANADQRAKPRTRKDLRKAVVSALERLYFNCDVFERASQQEIADLCQTNQSTVSRVLKQLEEAKQPQDPKPPVQTDFWSQLEGECNEALTRFSTLRKHPSYVRMASEDPEKAVTGLTALADALQQEYREIREHVKAIQEGIARS